MCVSKSLSHFIQVLLSTYAIFSPVVCSYFALCLPLQFISEGYASHLSQLEYSQRSRPAKTNSARMVLRKGSFGLGGSGDFLRKRNHLLRTISSQPGGAVTQVGQQGAPLPMGRPERAFSQSDGERERAERDGQRSMSVAAGCWGRTGNARLDTALLSPK